jgi:tetratricopeptide (TPR) repeat protein
LYQAGKFTEAIPLAERALALGVKALGPEHLDVATSLNNLALLYESQGRYAEAEPLYKRTITILETKTCRKLQRADERLLAAWGRDVIAKFGGSGSDDCW